MKLDVEKANVSAGAADRGLDDEAALSVERISALIDSDESVQGVVYVPRSFVATDFASPSGLRAALRRLRRAFVAHARRVALSDAPDSN
jgi:hypothetical protein